MIILPSHRHTAHAHGHSGCLVCSGTHGQAVKAEPVPKPGIPARYPWYLDYLPVNTRDISLLMAEIIERYDPEAAKWEPKSKSKVCRLLYRSITRDRDAITYQELSNAIRDRELAPADLRYQEAMAYADSLVDEWRQSYAAFVNEALAPIWREAGEHASSLIADGINDKWIRPGFRFTPSGTAINTYIEQHGAELAKYLTEAQSEAVRETLRYYIVDRPVGADDLARNLRAIIGLTKDQAAAVNTYREELLKVPIEERLSEAKIEQQVRNYEGYLHRRRARTIAITETSNAYNRGQVDAMTQAAAEGWFDLGDIVKEWFTMEDERTCLEICLPLHGKQVSLDANFPGINVRAPSAHPRCRCTIVFAVKEDSADAVTNSAPLE